MSMEWTIYCIILAFFHLSVSLKPRPKVASTVMIPLASFKPEAWSRQNQCTGCNLTTHHGGFSALNPYIKHDGCFFQPMLHKEQKGKYVSSVQITHRSISVFHLIPCIWGLWHKGGNLIQKYVVSFRFLFVCFVFWTCSLPTGPSN